jgi:hypothetical protein
MAHHDIEDDAKIWHYTSFPAFLSILQKRKLWFTRLDELRERDPFEGRSEQPNKTLFMERFEAFTGKGHAHCWSIDEEESDLMWATFAPKGVAIQSTRRRLGQSFENAGEERVIIGAVQYGTDWADPPDYAAFLKRTRFKREQELRAFVDHEYSYDSSGRECDSDIDGRYVNADLGVLIESVWVPPFATGLVSSVLRDEIRLHGLPAVPVEQRPTLAAAKNRAKTR